MANYTIEDIEILRQKSGISYEEAVSLLEYHNGSLARALVDLEKNGRIRDAKSAAGNPYRSKRGHHVFNYLFRLRLKIFKENITVANLSVLFLLIALLFAPWVLIIGLVVALVMGYRFTIERNSRAFADASLESMIKNAGNNVKNFGLNLARDLNAKQQSASQSAQQESKPTAPENRSQTAASGTTPVNVQFSEDGNIRVNENRDGFHEADIQ